MLSRTLPYALALAAIAAAPGHAQGTLRIAMTAADIPTTTGMPNNGFEGMRFLGYPRREELHRSPEFAELQYQVHEIVMREYENQQRLSGASAT